MERNDLRQYMIAHHDQERHPSTNTEWRRVCVHGCSSDAVDSHGRHLSRHQSPPESHDRHMSRHQSPPESRQTSERNNQRSDNSQHRARTSSRNDMETNRSSEPFISVDVETFLHSIGFIGEEETMIFDDIYRLLDEELNDDSDSALNYEETMTFDDTQPLLDGDEELNDESDTALNDEEPMILDDIYPLVEEDEGLDDGSNATLSYEGTMSFDDIYPLHEVDATLNDEVTTIFDDMHPLIDEDEELNDDPALSDDATRIFDDMYPFDEVLGDDSDEALSYEVLLTLQERLGRVSDGLSEEVISRHLKTRTHVTSTNHGNLKLLNKDEEYELCVVCQVEYENNEIVGILECGHEYHADCIKKWLLENNNCPVCRRTALALD